MQYKKGYVCFIDILGFSSYVKKTENLTNTYGLFDFVKKFCYLFNDSATLNTEISFYSDSIVLTTTEINKLILAIYIAETYLKKQLGLLFRGAICFGEYFHEKGITFGPGVIRAYELEKQAIYSRIIIDKEISIDTENINFFVDLDGITCLNPYSIILIDDLSFGDGVHYSEGEINSILIKSFENHRKEILDNIKKYKGTPVVDKYLWRIRPYNFICNLVSNIPFNEYIYEDIKFTNNKFLRDNLMKMIIQNNELINM